MLYPESGILFNTKKKSELTGHEKTWKKLTCILLSRKKMDSVRFQLGGTLQKTKYENTQKRQRLPEINRDEEIEREAQDFRMGNCSVWYYTVTSSHYFLFELMGTKLRMNVNYWLWVVMSCPCSFIHWGNLR